MRKRRREREELEGGMMAQPMEPRRITPIDVQQKEFRLSLRGYNEREVDEFLDALTEELARLHSENVRLRAEIETSEREARAAQSEAEATLRRAREEAARMLEEAEVQARSVRPEAVEDSPSLAEGPGVGTFLKKNSMVQAIRPFLGREREFLQSMARLIQEHADSVREEVRQIREVPPGVAGQEEDAGQSENRTALPAETAPESSLNEGGAPPPPAPAQGEAELPRRSRGRSAESGKDPSSPAIAATRSKEIAPEPRHAPDAEDGRRKKSRDGSVPSPSTSAPAERSPSGEPAWGDTAPEGPTDVFRPRRRAARPPVSPLEDDVSSRKPPFDEARPDLPMTQPFEPFRFDEHSDQSLERREGDEDERSLRELFWGEE